MRWLSNGAKLVGLTVLIIAVVVVTQKLSNTTTTQSLSPNMQYRASLVEWKPELPLRIDRNFIVRLATLDGSREEASETLFISPDEGQPIGSERFIWSKDSNFFLLVGRHFFVSQEIPLVGGEQAYLLYHVPTRRIWCNARQAAGHYSPLTAAELKGIEFTQPVIAPQDDSE